MKSLNFRFNITTALVLATVLFIAVKPTVAHAFEPESRAATSKLAQGKWVKIKVSRTGIHAITAADAKKWGLGDLSKVHVFGFGGAPLPEQMKNDIPDDLPQIPILRTGNRILFYAQGPTTWAVQKGDIKFAQVQHPYATAGYYFVTDDERYSDMELPKATTVVSGNKRINSFTERIFHEEELVNPGETGRNLLGEDFRFSTEQSFKFNLIDRIESSEVVVLTTFAAKTANAGSRLNFTCNGNSVDGNETIPMVDDIAHIHYMTGSPTAKKIDLQGTNELNWGIKYTPLGSLYLARLDRITVNYRRKLALNDNHIEWGQNDEASGTVCEVSGGSAETHVWDVTTGHSPVAMNTTLESNIIKFSPNKNGDHEYVAFNEKGKFPSPTKERTVENQNIHGEATPDMIIIAPTAYLEQARRIADMHLTVDSMRVLVVDQDKVFNEFSSGTPDAMAYRMMAKLFYDRGTDPTGHKLGYLLLFGNGTYDNRRLSSTVQAAVNYPMLLTWQSETSHSENTSYTSDDIFGVLQDNATATYEAYDIDIAVGRFPVKGVNEARIATDKLIKYVTTANNGAWKNNVIDVADDENSAIHMIQAEKNIKVSKANGGNDFIYNKVYLDAFTAESQGTGRFYPEARNKMFKLLDEGVIWFNYTGHASPNNWTSEGLLSQTDIAQKFFYKRYPILYAATCEFCRYDAMATSGGENLFLNPQGGMIAVISPARLAWISENGELHHHVAKFLFKRDNKGMPMRLGDVLRLGKNSYRNSSSSKVVDNNARYMLFGDPAMMPAFPSYKAEITSINGQTVTAENKPTFQARQTLTFAGKITDYEGKKVDFNGSIIATLYDSEQSVVSHGYGEGGEEYAFLDRPNKLAVKIDQVKNGEFSFKITIPTDVSTLENYSPSLINLYAFDNSVTANGQALNGGSREAMGANDNFYIYGYDDSVVADTIGPKITYFGLNSETFKDGDNVNESPLVLATFEDESGINLSSSGIGHAMTLTLDETTTYSDVSSYFSPNAAESSNGGSINYMLSNLSNGNHTLKLKVWDVFNNSSEKSITFNVMNGLKPEIHDVYTDANPASEQANFYVKHNRPEATISVTLQVFNLLGNEVWSKTQSGRSDMFTSFPITWNLTDNRGKRVARGIYVYRATISTNGVQEVTKSKKIAVTDAQ